MILTNYSLSNCPSKSRISSRMSLLEIMLSWDVNHLFKAFTTLLQFVAQRKLPQSRWRERESCINEKWTVTKATGVRSLAYVTDDVIVPRERDQFSTSMNLGNLFWKMNSMIGWRFFFSNFCNTTDRGEGKNGGKEGKDFKNCSLASHKCLLMPILEFPKLARFNWR